MKGVRPDSVDNDLAIDDDLTEEFYVLVAFKGHRELGLLTRDKHVVGPHESHSRWVHVEGLN